MVVSVQWYNTTTPEKEKLPLEWRDLDKKPFLKLLVVKTMRPDRLPAALTAFIEHTIPRGQEYAQCDVHRSGFEVTLLSLGCCCRARVVNMFTLFPRILSGPGVCPARHVSRGSFILHLSRWR